MWVRWIGLAVLVGAAGLASGCVTPLEYTADEGSAYMSELAGAGVPYGDAEVLQLPECFVGLPPELGRTHKVYEVPLGDELELPVFGGRVPMVPRDRRPLLAAIPNHPRSGAPVYLDLDRDGDFTNEGPLGQVRHRFGPSHGPVDVTIVQDGKRRPYRCWIAHRSSPGNFGWRVLPGCYMAGTVSIGGKEYRVALVDNDGTGRYDDYCWSGGWQGDWYYLDLDGDGRFRGRDENFMYSGQAVVDGRWYVVEASTDGTRLTFSRPDFELGEIRTGLDRFTVQLTGGGGAVVAPGEAGVAAAPVGEYKVISVRLCATDGEGHTWDLVSYHPKPEPDPVEVSADEALELLFGPPFTITLEPVAGPHRAGEQVNFRLVLRGRCGWRYGVWLKGGGSAPLGTVIITDADGTTVHTGTLTMDWYEWRVPEDLRGEVTAVPKLNLVGLEYSVEPVTLQIR